MPFICKRKGNSTLLAMTRLRCHSCGEEDAVEFFTLPRIPVDCGTLKSSHTAALAAKVAAIDLCFCNTCGLVFNRSYDHSLIAFGADYQVSLNCSPAFNEFQQATASRLASRYDLAGKTVFEIGCGNGEFLQTLCSTARCDGVGIDPTVKIDQLTVGGNQARFENCFFDQDYSGPIGDFVCCLSVFEDIKQPNLFLSQLRSRIGRQSIPVYLEVFNGMRALANNEVWSIHYEQCNCFSLDSLKQSVSRAGFSIKDAGYCYQGDQYLFVELEPVSLEAVPRDLDDSVTVSRKVVQGFEKAFLNRKKEWQEKLAQQARGDVVFWGSGGKAITFLNTVANASQIEYVIDNNSDRQGKYIPGSGHPVVSPDSLPQFCPQTVIISNEIYRDEIAAQISKMGLDLSIEVA